jgi:hypothetical protein
VGAIITEGAAVNTTPADNECDEFSLSEPWPLPIERERLSAEI